VPGGGFPVALAAGLALSGSIILLLFPPLGIAWALIGGVLAGMVVRQARHVVTVTAAAVALPFATPFFATCLTGVWGWFAVGIIAASVLLVGVTPAMFLLGRALRHRLDETTYPVLRGLIVVGAVLAVLGWVLAIVDAVNPGSCPPGPGSA
jgi:hypothetical protein